MWIIKYNGEYYTILKILHYIQELQNVGHVQKLLASCKPKKGTKAEFNDNRPDGRPGFRWEEGVKEDAVRLLRCCSWKLGEE